MIGRESQAGVLKRRLPGSSLGQLLTRRLPPLTDLGAGAWRVCNETADMTWWGLEDKGVGLGVLDIWGPGSHPQKWSLTAHGMETNRLRCCQDVSCRTVTALSFVRPPSGPTANAGSSRSAFHSRAPSQDRMVRCVCSEEVAVVGTVEETSLDGARVVGPLDADQDPMGPSYGLIVWVSWTWAPPPGPALEHAEQLEFPHHHFKSQNRTHIRPYEHQTVQTSCSQGMIVPCRFCMNADDASCQNYSVMSNSLTSNKSLTLAMVVMIPAYGPLEHLFEVITKPPRVAPALTHYTNNAVQPASRRADCPSSMSMPGQMQGALTRVSCRIALLDIGKYQVVFVSLLVMLEFVAGDRVEHMADVGTTDNIQTSLVGPDSQRRHDRERQAEALLTCAFLYSEALWQPEPGAEIPLSKSACYKIDFCMQCRKVCNCCAAKTNRGVEPSFPSIPPWQIHLTGNFAILFHNCGVGTGPGDVFMRLLNPLHLHLGNFAH
ncbi:uncharacterized protein B0I36DRAFT_412942 [Microdochium trichocladiopsis]|uniref:Uncharacterized protein n=1 Tax=Microdochium trichocladiopsis TaxID=1682393 RepID=A0A9P8Y406_9PEZI|nr:uncharacterized protein B0I36DRAFT_412942 [Microdochium trichocladiopsis]KAH7027522.1 hypothetical protein B0I36DRAFT_412942 [Microdochium trichocladiopsis]